MKFRFVYSILCVSAILIFAVYLRSANNRTFYKLYMLETSRSRLKQQLGNKQLQVEGLINPAAVAERLEQE